MNAQATRDAIHEDRIIAIVRGISSPKLLPTIQALREGGIRLIEVTLDQSSPEGVERTLADIGRIHNELGESVLLGAGTVMDADQAERAIQAGAEYLISPHVDRGVIETAKHHGKVSIPGALTPTEAAEAYAFGADFVKLFPAGLFGVPYLKALRGPLSNIPFLVVGNISLNNIAGFLDAGAAGTGVGGELVDKKAIAAGEYDKVTRTAQSYLKQTKRG